MQHLATSVLKTMDCAAALFFSELTSLCQPYEHFLPTQRTGLVSVELWKPVSSNGSLLCALVSGRPPTGSAIFLRKPLDLRRD
jgi:hypothetical protein